MSVIERLQNIIWPHADLISNRVDMQNPALLKGEGFSLLRFVSAPHCQVCGVPLYFETSRDEICAACLAEPPIFDVARAALEYDEYSKPMIFALKRAGQRQGLKTMARWMYGAAANIIDEADCIVPVPLHYTRHAQRGFNQALWLAAALGRVSGKPVLRDAVVRKKATPSQGLMSNAQRKKNVEGVFDIAKSEKIKDMRVVLVDDVFTTGATVSACAKILKQEQARHVAIVTLARIVFRESETT